MEECAEEKISNAKNSKSAKIRHSHSFDGNTSAMCNNR